MPRLFPIEDLPPEILALVKKAKSVRRRAYAPYSRFLVGCVLVDERGKIHTGCNVENVSFSATMCAERVALGKMVSRGGQKINAVLVLTSSHAPVFPCGVCLQMLNEFGRRATVYAVNRKGTAYCEAPLSQLLPHGFQKQQLASK